MKNIIEKVREEEEEDFEEAKVNDTIKNDLD